MREVAVLGIGQTQVNEHWAKSLRDLAGDAILKTVKDANFPEIEAIYVGNMLSGSASLQQHLGAYIADWVGFRYRQALRVEAACSSGAAAFRSALMAVSSGEIDSAIAVGVEKMTDSPGAKITNELATAADADWETAHGISFVGLNALIMQRYMHEYKWNHEDFAVFSINAHANAVYNPNARFRNQISKKDFSNAVIVADPITILDASPIGDGAAAALLVPMELLKRQGIQPIIKV
ncbi:MAG: thiolase domain-containing protein, partial [Anaerolineaceae bacterium]|nr:thiolase domain-containing protein [Anaerolineaceae bacterium]